MSERITIEVVRGPEGPCLLVNEYRVAGPKPWGGGTVTHEWRVDANMLRSRLAEIGYVEPCREAEAMHVGEMGARHDADQQLADVAGRMKAYGYDAETLRVLTDHILGGAEIPMPAPGVEGGSDR